MTYNDGFHFLQIPGPSNIPGEVLRAIEKPTIDHRGTDFGMFTRELLEKTKKIFQTDSPIIIFPASGTGAWEAALVNTLSPGDKTLMFETGHFASLWNDLAIKLGIKTEFIEGDWRHGISSDKLQERLSADRKKEIKAVCCIHNETSTGIVSNIEDIRKAIDSENHPALLLVDTISSLGSIDYRHQDWGVDVTIACSQKGLMLPPGLSFNAISEKALLASKKAKSARSYWDWEPMLKNNIEGFFPYTPATNLLFGLDVACDMLLSEGLDSVFIRHARFGEATRQAVQAWGLETVCMEPSQHSNVLTGVFVPENHDADHVRKIILERFNMSLGTGLGKLKGKVFRIGHLGHFNDLMLIGSLGGVEMGFELADIPHQKGGVSRAMNYLISTATQ
ncbi:MAG: serine--glyoxylate aminotransferase [Magnetovibrio sp.]|nr:serine--glyoxylate aminotransferase [Magnetovibrio sp.]